MNLYLQITTSVRISDTFSEKINSLCASSAHMPGALLPFVSISLGGITQILQHLQVPPSQRPRAFTRPLSSILWPTLVLSLLNPWLLPAAMRQLSSILWQIGRA